ncbi:unnamed protein product, partial [Allacma fusca]
VYIQVLAGLRFFATGSYQQ